MVVRVESFENQELVIITPPRKKNTLSIKSQKKKNFQRRIIINNMAVAACFVNTEQYSNQDNF